MSARARGLSDLVTRSIAIQAAAALAIALVAAGIYLAYREQSEDVTRAQDAQTAVAHLRGEVLSGQGSVRGFALTGDREFLVPYIQSAASVPDTAAAVRQRLEEDERRLLDAGILEVDRWRREFAVPLLGHTTAGDFGAARELARTKVGKRRIDVFRNRVAQLDRALDTRVARLERRRDRLAAIGLVAIGIAALVSTSAALLLRRRLGIQAVQPVEGLAAAAHALAAGRLSTRIEPQGVHEAQVAAEAFNSMAVELEQVVSGLREVDEIRTRFVGSAAHELRTPLTAIVGHVDELRSGELGALPDEQRETLDIVARSADHLGRMIDDLLLLARLEGGGIELSRDEVAIGPLLEDLVAELRPAAASRGLELRLAAEDGLVANGDALRLRQAFANLLSNAIKFGREETDVDVAATGSGDTIVVDFEDRGVGIPASELPRVAERFFRASTATGVKGTGLGLAITRELVERHGGRLEVQSEEGRGSVFRITLPRAGQAGVAETGQE